MKSNLTAIARSVAPDSIIRKERFISPVYIKRYYSASKETAKIFTEHPDVARYRGECVDGSEDNFLKWCKKNSVWGFEDYEGFLIMGENGTLNRISLKTHFLSHEDAAPHLGIKIPGGMGASHFLRMDYVWKEIVTITSQPSSKEIPRELLAPLLARGYFHTYSESPNWDFNLVSFPPK